MTGLSLQERVAGLAAFVPVFEREGFRFSERHFEQGAASVTALTPEAAQFEQEAYRLGWVLFDFDWSAWGRTEEGQRLAMDVAAIAEADPDALARLLTAHIRNERFCDGHLGATFESGHLTAIVRRAKELVDNSPKIGS